MAALLRTSARSALQVVEPTSEVAGLELRRWRVCPHRLVGVQMAG